MIPSPPPTREAGNILVSIMAVMVLVTYLAGNLIVNFAVPEAAEIEEFLAKQRIYWAMMGETNYVGQRARVALATDLGGPTPTDEAMRAQLEVYLGELSGLAMDVDLDNADDDVIVWSDNDDDPGAVELSWEYPEYLVNANAATSPARYLLRLDTGAIDPNPDPAPDNRDLRLLQEVNTPVLPLQAGQILVPSVQSMTSLRIASLQSDIAVQASGQFSTFNINRVP